MIATLTIAAVVASVHLAAVCRVVRADSRRRLAWSEVEVHPTERDLSAYVAAATVLARQIDERGYGEIVLQPGDATAYPFIILPKHRLVSVVSNGELEHLKTRRDYLVILAASFGRGYEWGGQSMHWDYCAAKWTTDGHEWTGRVVCLLLNHLSPLLAEASP